MLCWETLDPGIHEDVTGNSQFGPNCEQNFAVNHNISDCFYSKK